MLYLALAFFVTAVLYASVGFGGGSTYAALLAISGVDYRILPMLALTCNIVVVAGGTVRFARAGVTPWMSALGITAIAAPAAFLGGLTPIDERAFLLLLGGSLMLTGMAMLLPVREQQGEPHRGARFVWIAAAPLGYLAGLVGIGGGIFLAPLLHLARWRTAREIAATASLFILVNSAFGLAGQILKGGEGRFLAAFDLGLALIVAVAIGGQIGSLLAVRLVPGKWIRRISAILVLLVGTRLLLGS